MLTSAMTRAEQLFGQNVGVVCGSDRFTYREFGVRCRRLAAGLKTLGVSSGDRVAILMQNCHRYLEAYVAVPAIGAIIVPLNTRHSGQELESMLDDCGARLLLLDVAFIEMAEKLERFTGAVVIAPDQYEQLVESSEPAALHDHIEETDLAAIFYTGGTSGAPKGVMLSHRNLVANAFHMTVAAQYDERDRFLHAAPMFHLADASSIHALTWRGSKHVILPRFAPEPVLNAIANERVTCTILVPTMIQLLVNHSYFEQVDLASLRLILHGGAPISTDLLRRAVCSIDCSFTQAYGLTEASSHVAMLAKEENLLDDARIRSAGRPVMGIDLRVCRPDGSQCPTREIGEVTVRGATVTAGYWNKPEDTHAALRDGWFWTGDLGYLDDEGFIFLVDRAKDMIVSGGENVYSTEVEQVLKAHPEIAEVAVIGVPDSTWGERVHAVIVAQDGQKLKSEEVRVFCKQRIAGYKCPRSIGYVDAMPLSGAGKVLKQQLRDRHQPSSESEGG